MPFTIISCQDSPKVAAQKTCDCMQDAVNIWQKDEKMEAILKTGECGQMQEDYRKEFSGTKLETFNTTYDTCLQETIKSEILLYLLRK